MVIRELELEDIDMVCQIEEEAFSMPEEESEQEADDLDDFQFNAEDEDLSEFSLDDLGGDLGGDLGDEDNF